MTHLEFVQIFSAVLAANAITVGAVYAVWWANQTARRLDEVDGSRYWPWWVYLVIVAVLGVWFIAISGLGALSA